MLTALPVAALGGVPVFDVVEDLGPIPPHPFAVRIATVRNWLDLPPPVLTYDPEDLARRPLLTDEPVDWMREAGRPATAWILSGKPEGYTREAAQADHRKWLQERRFAEALAQLDDTETRLFLEGIERGQSGEVPFEVALADCRRAIETHRATRWAD